MENSLSTEEKSFQLNQVTLGYLAESAKWAKFLAIIGYIFIGFMVLVSVTIGLFLPSMNSGLNGAAAGSQIPGFSSTVLMFVYLILAAIYVYPVYALYGFASKMQKVIKENIESEIENAFNQLKKFFKFFGILTIVMLGLYVLIIIAAIFAGLAAAFA